MLNATLVFPISLSHQRSEASSFAGRCADLTGRPSSLLRGGLPTTALPWAPPESCPGPAAISSSRTRSHSILTTVQGNTLTSI